MKYEKPIAEIRRLDPVDVLATSGTTAGEDPTEKTYSERYDTIHEGECVGGAPDNNITNCF